MNVLGLPIGYFFGKWELKELECWLISTIVGIVASLVTFCKNLRSAVLWKFAVRKPDHRQPLKRCVLYLFMRLPCGGLLFIPHYTGSYVNRGNIPSIINSSHSFLFCNSGIWSNQYKFMNESQRLRVGGWLSSHSRRRRNCIQLRKDIFAFCGEKNAKYAGDVRIVKPQEIVKVI